MDFTLIDCYSELITNHITECNSVIMAKIGLKIRVSQVRFLLLRPIYRGKMDLDKLMIIMLGIVIMYWLLYTFGIV